MKMSTFSGDQVVQVSNPDPFATPVWRSPVFHTPGWVITIVQLYRLLERPKQDLALIRQGSFMSMGLVMLIAHSFSSPQARIPSPR